jgi:hypothetical protein
MNAVMRALLICFGLVLSHPGCAQTPGEPVRVYADSVVKLIVENDENALFEHFVPSIRSAYPRDLLVKPLSQIRKRHGKNSTPATRQDGSALLVLARHIRTEVTHTH